MVGVEVQWCPPRGRVLSYPEPGACVVCVRCVSVCLFVCCLFVLGHLFPFFSSTNEMIRSSPVCSRKKISGIYFVLIEYNLIQF
jgi:hypothetical protein